MAKTTAPLLSFGGSGQIAKTMVYSTWKGVPYVRRHVVPANPNTLAQQATRTLFAQLREMWKVAPSLVTDAWNAFALGRPFTGMNKYVGENIRVLRGEADFANFIGSPGAKGGPAPTTWLATTGAGSGEINVDFTVPSPPTGWTLKKSVVSAFPDQTPGGIFTGIISAYEITVAPWDHAITGLQAGTDYVVSGWLVWEKPDGSAAYSVGTSQIVASGA